MDPYLQDFEETLLIGYLRRLGLARRDRMAPWAPAGRSRANGFRCCGSYDWYVPVSPSHTLLKEVARGDPKSGR